MRSKQRRFLLGAFSLVGVVGYLMATGMRDAMTYYYTPAELVSRVGTDPTLRDLGVKVGGRVVPGTIRWDARALDLQFVIMEIDSVGGRARFPVRYQGPLPDTFQEGRDVVVEGRLSRAGVFEASTVLTKCGSRYEAVEEELRT